MRRYISWFLLGLIIFFVVGCGHGNHLSAPDPTRLGSIRLTIAWPGNIGTRAIPEETVSITVEARYQDTVYGRAVINRPANTATLDHIPCGTITVEAKAYAGENGTGELLAEGRTTVTVFEGKTAAARITLSLVNFSCTPGISGGDLHSLALKSDGTVWAWGWNGPGQLGDGTQTDSSTPVQVSGLKKVIAIAAGGSHSLALKSDGTVWAWGGNLYGQLGDGTETNRPTPVQVSGLSNVIAIAAGRGYHSLALKSDGTVWAWGDNYNGQLGDGTRESKSTPVQVSGSSGLSGVVAIASGYHHSLALTSDGTVWAWGWNGSGQLGDGTTTDRSTPVLVSGLSNVIAIAGGGHHSLAVKSDGTVWAWGMNNYGQLGDGTTIGGKNAPVQVSGLSGVIGVGGGFLHSLALKSDGTVWAWGYNLYGQLGDGTTTEQHTPVQVIGLSECIKATRGIYHSLALKSDGTIWAWGKNDRGQLGNGTNTDSSIPVQVVGLDLDD